MIFTNFSAKIDSFPLKWQYLAQIFDILRKYKAKNVKMLKKLHLKFEQVENVLGLKSRIF